MAARFSDQFLDDLRSKVPISEVASGKVKGLKRKGSEFVGFSPFNKEDTASFTIYDKDRRWHDFSSGKDGDVFELLVEIEGRTFPEAVEIVAGVAGVPMPNGDGRSAAAAAPSRNGAVPPTPGPPEPPIGIYDVDASAADRGGHAAAGSRPGREITRAYDYTDAAGNVLYQVCRIEWVKDGKTRKTFSQRRPTPENDGRWIWGLDAGEYIRGRDGDWYKATEDRVARWKNAPRREIAEAVSHGLYRLVEFIELRQAGEPVYIAEGEKDVDTLVEWGCVATTNSGGARNWRADHAEMFRGLDVVLAIDNDQAGRDRANIIGETMRGIARSVRVLDVAASWPDAPKGADVTDWKRYREGTPDELRELTASAPPWKPPPFASKFGGIPFEDLDTPGPEHEYLIDGWLTVGDKSIIGGPSRSGKSFIAIHTAMCIVRAMDFFGCKVMAPGLVVYQAGEGARGVKKRFRAWRQYFGIAPGERVPLYILQSKIDLYRPDGDTKAFVEELQGVQKLYGMPIRALFIDTLAKAQGLADENSGKDMSAVMANIDTIAAAVPGCHVALVHHFNAAGTKLRGHSSIYANIDQVVLVTKEEDSKIRSAVLDKQKDDEDGAIIKFELMQIELGRRESDGKPITSCVTLQVGERIMLRSEQPMQRPAVTLSNQQTIIYRALVDAIEEFGEPPPATLKLPRAIKKVVNYRRWTEVYRRVAHDEKENTVHAAMKRAYENLMRLRLIGRSNPFVWLTGRGVAMVPPVDGSQPPPDAKTAPADDGQQELIGDDFGMSGFPET